MFGRRKKEARGPDGLVTALVDLGFVGPDSTSVRSGGKEADRSLHSSETSRSYEASFLEKNTSISGGNISHTTHRSSVYAGRPRTSAADTMGSRTRRERTFLGADCAYCDEPIQHMLRGEKLLQFTCGHVGHEACFYEAMREAESQYCPTCNAPLNLDTNRVGNTIDIEKISNMVQAQSISSGRSQSTPTEAWEETTTRPPSRSSNARSANVQVARSVRESDRYTAPSRHARSDSEVTGVTSSGGYPETLQSGPSRRHDYDVQAMETSLASPRSTTRNPIPAPTVSVRSEFPTISRSRQQQTLTCLVTIEVADCKWQPGPEDLGAGLSGLPGLPPTSSRTGEGRGGAGAGAGAGAGSRSPVHGSPAPSAPRFYPYESAESLAEMTEKLQKRVDNWHGLDFDRFGNLRLYGTLRVGKDKVSWQELECFLFAEMLICVKEKKISHAPLQWDDEDAPRKSTRCTLKGSILIKKHLDQVSESGTSDENILTLALSVLELPQFHLRFESRNQLKLWQQALLDLNAVEGSPIGSPIDERADDSDNDEDEWHRIQSSHRPQRASSAASSWGGARSATTAPTEYTNFQRSPGLPSIHVPVDVVVVVPVSASMQGVKISLVRDALRFMVQNLGERDRMGLVTFGSSGGGVPIVGMTTKAWHGWGNVFNSIKPVGQKSHRADVVEGANVAMDLLMGRKYNNPVASIMLISDASTSDADSVDFVVSRAEAAKIAIYSFGLGMTHKPDTMIELSTRTKAAYAYVKDWMMLRECLAGCLGSLQTLSHQNVKLKVRLPEGSPAKFHKISGALQISKRATGREAEASLGDLRFGDRRDILVQLVITPDNSSQDQLPQDAWDNIVSGLEALGGPMENDEQRVASVEEVPLIQADISWGDYLGGGSVQQSRPSLLAITMLPAGSSPKKAWVNHPPIPPLPSIVQRRMELLTSDMLTRALTLVSKGQHDRAFTLLNETRSILKGLGKGNLPPVPPTSAGRPLPVNSPQAGESIVTAASPDRKHTPSPPGTTAFQAAVMSRTRSNDALGITAAMASGSGIDTFTVASLDAELESSLEWISHPAVFGRDSRKAVLQAIGVISSQRAFTFRTSIESLWAARIAGVRRLTDRSREWREDNVEGAGILEEA